MKCVSCGYAATAVVDSRPTGYGVRRRRRCGKCGARFVTRELAEIEHKPDEAAQDHEAAHVLAGAEARLLALQTDIFNALRDVRGQIEADRKRFSIRKFWQDRVWQKERA